MIRPTNGRVVLFTPTTVHPTMVQLDIKQPLTAHVVHVWGDRLVNLIVFDSFGVAWPETSVTLLQDDDRKPDDGRFCSWMDYQKGQAAKTEAAEAKLNGKSHDPAAMALKATGQMQAQTLYVAPSSDPA